MKQISFRIPDTQVSFMMELLQKFDFVKIDTPVVDNGFVLTEVLDWDSVKNNLKVD